MAEDGGNQFRCADKKYSMIVVNGSSCGDLMVNGNGLFPKEFVFLSSC